MRSAIFVRDAPPRFAFAALVAAILRRRRERRIRAALNHLSDAQLRDIGLDPATPAWPGRAIASRHALIANLTSMR